MASFIPPDAKKVFDGIIFEVWQWEQKEYNGEIHPYERLRRSNSGTVIPVIGEQILIEYQEQPARDPFISFPGGMIEYGKDPLEETQREMREETGYTSDDWEHFKTFNPSGHIEWSSFFYIARDCKKMGEPQLEGGEKIRTAIISFDEMLALADDPLFRHKDLEATLVRARYDADEQRVLKQLLFGS